MRPRSYRTRTGAGSPEPPLRCPSVNAFAPFARRFPAINGDPKDKQNTSFGMPKVQFLSDFYECISRLSNKAQLHCGFDLRASAQRPVPLSVEVRSLVTAGNSQPVLLGLTLSTPASRATSHEPEPGLIGLAERGARPSWARNAACPRGAARRSRCTPAWTRSCAYRSAGTPSRPA